MNIGKLITQYRKEAGLTIDELAERSGISKSTINKIISGASKAPTLESIRALASAMGKTLNDFDDDKKRASTISAEALKIAQKYERLNNTSKGAVSALITYYETSMGTLLDLRPPLQND